MSATLASLRIRNLALVEEMTWEMQPGFTAITGETGAGKSIILGALTLVLGERADRELIRSGAESCVVEAVFESVDDQRVSALLDSHGTEPCEEGRLIVKRVVSASSAGKQFVNGSACPLALLRSLGNFLVDLHGPHDHQSLFSREQQTLLLDSFSGSEEIREQFANARRGVLALLEERDSILRDQQSLARELDLLTHQVNEIETARLLPSEEEQLLSRQRVAANARRIAELCHHLILETAERDDSLLARLESLARPVRELVRFDDAAGEIDQAFQSVFMAGDDLARAVQSYCSALESSSIDLTEIESRLDTIQTLRRKYGNSIQDILNFAEQARCRIDELAGRTERRESLDGDILLAQETMRASGGELSVRRRRGSAKLAEKIRGGLKSLGFAKADFSVSLEKLDAPTQNGNEAAEFLFSPNPGEPPRPLRTIASSGEISRVMLAIKSALADQDNIPVLLFDEIDANIGGEIAAKVGSKMQELGRSRQLFCITHLPQVAAAASHHFVVTKEVSDHRTRTLLVEASGRSREEEIARMLGGQSKSALGHARTLLKAEP